MQAEEKVHSKAKKKSVLNYYSYVTGHPCNPTQRLEVSNKMTALESFFGFVCYLSYLLYYDWKSELVQQKAQRRICGMYSYTYDFNVIMPHGIKPEFTSLIRLPKVLSKVATSIKVLSPR